MFWRWERRLRASLSHVGFFQMPTRGSLALIMSVYVILALIVADTEMHCSDTSSRKDLLGGGKKKKKKERTYCPVVKSMVYWQLLLFTSSGPSQPLSWDFPSGQSLLQRFLLGGQRLCPICIMVCHLPLPKLFPPFSFYKYYTSICILNSASAPDPLPTPPHTRGLKWR